MTTTKKQSPQGEPNSAELVVNTKWEVKRFLGLLVLIFRLRRIYRALHGAERIDSVFLRAILQNTEEIVHTVWQEIKRLMFDIS